MSQFVLELSFPFEMGSLTFVEKHMPATTAKSYEVEVATGLLQGAGELLQRHQWFATDWLVDVHQFPPAPEPADGITLHVFRPHWFNEDGQGIHFETFLGPREWQRRQMAIMMHIFHGTHIPGTAIKRRDVARPFVDAVFDLVSSWSGYTFRVGRYGTQPFTCVLEFEPDTLESQLEQEFSRLCRELGPVMDLTLKQVLEK